MADVHFHPEAEAEYQEALAWYRGRSQRAAERFEAEMDQVLGLVASNPERFPLYEEDYRFIMLRRFPYSVVYLMQPGLIEVIAVAHSRRSAGYWRGRA